MGFTKLTEVQIQKELADLIGWSIANCKVERDFTFSDFVEAFGFMTKAAMHIERMNHHPEWFNVYNKITVELVTHDAGGITQNDVSLAKTLNSLAG